MRIKRVMSFFIVISLLFSIDSWALFSSDLNTVARSSSHPISPGLVYTNSVEVCEGIRQEIHSFDYTPGMGTEIVPVFGEYIYGASTLGNMISAYDGAGRVVGGINTDFFITNTGIPLSCLVRDKEVISTCEGRAAIAFDENGEAIIGYPKLSAKIYSETLELPVAHINKTPAEWGMYLVTDTFSYTTKSTLDSIEIVFTPFDKEETEKAIHEKEISEDIDEHELKEAELLDSKEQEREQDKLDNLTSQDTNNEIENTDTQLEYDFSDYIFTDDKPEINSETDMVVTAIYDGVTNSVIPKGSYVLSVPKELFGHNVTDISVGDEFSLKIDCDEYFNDAVNIFGAGSIILFDGEFVEQVNDSIYTSRNPRTAAGIKPDGSIMFVSVDGRRAGESAGFTIRELADYLLANGCKYAVNFDGGGSTTFYAAGVGELESNLKNTPSAGSERGISDGMLFINTLDETGNVENGQIYPSDLLVFSEGTTIELSEKVLFADENYHPVEVEDGEVFIFVDSEYGLMSENTFYPNGKTGRAPIYALLYSETEIEVGHVNITDTADKLVLKSDILDMTPFDDYASIDLSAFLNTIPIKISPESAEFEILNYKVDEDGLLTEHEVHENDAYIDLEKMQFIPFKKGETYVIRASLGGISENIKITTEAYPFADMQEHWSKLTAYDMYKKGLIIGEIAYNGERNFVPERNMSVAEFCVLLSRVLGLDEKYKGASFGEAEEIITDETLFDDTDIDIEVDINIDTTTDDVNDSGADEEIITELSEEESEQPLTDDIKQNLIIGEEYDLSAIPDWAIKEISYLISENLIAPILTYTEEGKTTLDTGRYITRNDVIKVIGSILSEVMLDSAEHEESPIEAEYPDYIPDNVSDYEAFRNIINAGIIRGYEDGTIRQFSNLTRAEAATVFSRFYNFILPYSE